VQPVLFLIGFFHKKYCFGVSLIFQIIILVYQIGLPNIYKILLITTFSEILYVKIVNI